MAALDVRVEGIKNASLNTIRYPQVDIVGSWQSVIWLHIIPGILAASRWTPCSLVQTGQGQLHDHLTSLLILDSSLKMEILYPYNSSST
jgi:hypothetical protein